MDPRPTNRIISNGLLLKNVLYACSMWKIKIFMIFYCMQFTRNSILKRFAGPANDDVVDRVDTLKESLGGKTAFVPCAIWWFDEGEVFSKNVITFQLFEQYNKQYAAPNKAHMGNVEGKKKRFNRFTFFRFFWNIYAEKSATLNSWICKHLPKKKEKKKNAKHCLMMWNRLYE